MENPKYIVMCIINALCLAIGQILFKLGTTEKEMSNIKQILGLLFTPVILFALGLYACTTLFWMYILSKINLSQAYPIQALAFPTVMLLSAFIFKEHIPLNRWIGVGMIMIGINLVILK